MPERVGAGAGRLAADALAERQRAVGFDSEFGVSIDLKLRRFVLG